MAIVIPPKPQYNRFEIASKSRDNIPFQKYVFNVLFPPHLFTLVKRTSNSLPNSAEQGFILRNHSNGFEFYIECRHHYSLIANSFKFNKSSRFERYEGRPLFLILGLGGSAENPNEIFLANFNDCPVESLRKRHLCSKSIPADKAVTSSALLKQEDNLTFKKTA